ncbi:unnamed protein product, partial [Allacma fusca]
ALNLASIGLLCTLYPE